MAYLLDANVFIEAKKRYYAFDICPGFWDWLDRQAEAGTILSVRAVHDEILAGGDDLTEWANDRRGLFHDLDATVLPHMQTLAAWVGRQNYSQAAVTEFLDSADYSLVATAMAHGHTVVTHELPSGGAKKVKIPEPCVAHDVPFINSFVMLRRMGARFALVLP